MDLSRGADQIYEGKVEFVLDPKEIGLEPHMKVDTVIQNYVLGNSQTFLESPLKEAIDKSIKTGEPVDFTISGLGVHISFHDMSFTEAGKIIGDFTVDVSGQISASASGEYSISNGVAKIVDQDYNFELDAVSPNIFKDTATNFAIGLAGSRPNMNGPNAESNSQKWGGANPNYNSTYGDADISVKVNRTYDFESRGRH